MPIKGAVRFDDQARFHPLKFGLGVVKYVAEQGVQIFENSRAIDIEENDGYVVTTSQGKRVTANKVIIATHYPFYNKHGMYFARIYTERAYALAIKAKEKFPGGMYINADDPARSTKQELRMANNTGRGDHHKPGECPWSSTMKPLWTLPIPYSRCGYTLPMVTQDCMTIDGLPYVRIIPLPPIYVFLDFKNRSQQHRFIGNFKGCYPWQEPMAGCL